jgi:hypothetical protein
MRLSFAGAFIAGALLAAAAVPAAAHITILEGDLLQAPEEDLVLNSGTKATQLVGTTSLTATEVNITGEEPLWEPTQGSSRVLAWDQGLNAFDLTLANPHLGFTSFEFNLFHPHTAGTVTLTAYDQFGNTFGNSFDLATMDWNPINITATDGQLITRISFVSTADLQSVREIRLGGVTPFPAVVEPGAWAMMITGFGCLGTLVRRRRARVALATI